MTNPLPPHPLFDLPFSERLDAYLAELQSQYGQTVALLELELQGGNVLPVWRAGGKGSVPLEVFDALSSGPLTPALQHALGAVFHDLMVSIVRLEVRPRLAQGADALLALGRREGTLGLQPSVIDELTRALSLQRQRHLAQMVYAAVDQAPDAIEITDQDARIVYTNQGWERFFGYRHDESVGRTVGSLLRDPVRPLHDPAFYQFTLAQLHAGRSWVGSIMGRAASGDRVISETQVSPFESAGARGHFAVRRGLGQRAERDEALISAHREFRQVLSALPDGAVVLRDERIYFANAAFLAMVRHAEPQVIGASFLDLVFADDRGLLAQAYRGEIAWVRMRTSNGSLRMAEISAAGSLSFEGVPAVILLSRDTTDVRLAQEQLARAERLSALGSLAAGVAHEINNPLGYVLLNLEMVLQRVEPQAEMSTLLREGIDGVRRIQSIVSELRGLSGAHSPGPPEPVDVTQAVNSALNIAHNEIRHRARLERRHEEPLFVMAREGPLVQVLLNLLLNAAQALPEHEEDHVISVYSGLRRDGMVEIVVTDTGTGIPPEILPNLFVPFTSSKRRGEGVGLGLAICKRIIDGFGGTISITSAPRRGTQATLALPQAHRVATSSTPPAAQLKPQHSARILIIDDEGPLVRALTRVLSQHHVMAAHDGTAALAMLLDPHRAFDVVMCDLMMPGLSGGEIYRVAVAARPALRARFLFMTGGAFTDSGRTFLEQIGSRVLVKPFDPPTLLQRIEEMLASSEAPETQLER